jgi:transposase
MHVEEWICSECGAAHTRDGNAAINLRKLGTAVPNQRAAT